MRHLLLAGLVLFLLLRFVLKPLVDYFRDAKSLRRFPNASAISGITNLWFVFEAYRGRRYLPLQEKHQNGPCSRPILRIGPNHLSFTSPEAIKDIHGHGTVMEKGVHYDLISGTHRHLADVVDRNEHSRKRKMLAAAFAQSRILDYDYILATKMKLLGDQFDKACMDPDESGQPLKDAPTLDYRRWAVLYTQETIAALGLSESLGFIEGGDDLTRQDGSTYLARYRESIEGGMHKDCVLIAMPEWYKTLLAWFCFFLPNFQRYKARADGFSDIVRHQTRKRLAREGKENLTDFFSAMLYDRKQQPYNLEFGELYAEVNVILNAGSDSTGIAMTNTIWSLIKNPRALQVLREELDAVLSDEDIVAPYEKVRYLPYLRACLDESMRMNAPSQFSLPRKTPPEGARIAGHWIAGDVQVTTPTHAIHMDPAIWKDPEVFRPERWFGEEGKQLQQFFLVFTTGPRGCIGRNVTYLEQYGMLATMAKRYEFCLADESFQPTRYETVATIVDALPLKIWRRKPNGADTA
jgi:cytochrome P450